MDVIIEEEENTSKGNRLGASVAAGVSYSISQTTTSSSSVFSTELLNIYYKRLFPYKQMFDWLSYGTDPSVDTYFLRREFSFTIENDVYIRYLSFKDMYEMQKEIIAKQPHKIDIGPVYSAPAKDHNSVNDFKALERELVFDIDLDDYKDVRVGASDPNANTLWTNGSWLYMSTAIKVLNKALRDDFGFQHILFVFSGRRGVHCWVCDSKARKLEDSERTAIAQYLTLIVGAESSGKDLRSIIPLSNPMHPSVERSLTIVEKIFKTMVLPERNGQGLLADEERYEKVLSFIPDYEVQQALRDTWKEETKRSKTLSTIDLESGTKELSTKSYGKKELSVSEQRWRTLVKTVEEQERKKRNVKTNDQADKLATCIPAIMLYYVYPRLDINVSTHRNHLLKSPFVIHPKTGKVCVPILNVDSCHEFDPDTVPNLVTLVNEIDAESKKLSENIQSMDVDEGSKRLKTGDSDPLFADVKTSLDPYVNGFEKQFLAPLRQENKKEKKLQQQNQKDASMNW